MISLDLAPNENAHDAMVALSILVQPWRWMKGKYSVLAKTKLKRFFPGHEPYFFLSARGALYKALQALQLKDGSEVLVLGFTCEAVVIPITALGLKPVFVDIEDETYSAEFKSVKERLSNQTKAIILQHTFGITPRYREEVLTLAHAKKIAVIEDLAHGFDPEVFSADDSTSMKLLSFGRSKAISSVFGGALLTNDTKLQERLKNIEKRLLRPQTGFVLRCLLYKPVSVFIRSTYNTAKIGRGVHWILNSIRFFPKELTEREKRGIFDEKMAAAYPNAFAILLNEQLKQFESVSAKRTQVVAQYNDVFHSVEVVQPLCRYPVLVQERETLMRSTRSKQIFLSRWYHTLQSPEGECPIAQRVANEIVNLPTTAVSEHDLQTVLKQVELHIFHHHP